MEDYDILEPEDIYDYQTTKLVIFKMSAIQEVMNGCYFQRKSPIIN